MIKMDVHVSFIVEKTYHRRYFYWKNQHEMLYWKWQKYEEMDYVIKVYIIFFKRCLFLVKPWRSTPRYPLWNIKLHTLCEVETYTRDTRWQKNLIDVVITFVTWPTCFLQSKSQDIVWSLFFSINSGM